MALAPFQTLIDLHGRAVHRYLVAIVGAHDADDCWQEAFLSARRNLHEGLSRLRARLPDLDPHPTRR